MSWETLVKVGPLLTLLLGVIYFAWIYWGRHPRIGIVNKVQDNNVWIKITILNPGGQPFTVDCAVSRRGRLVTPPLMWVVGDPYEYWPAGDRLQLGRKLSPGEQVNFDIYVEESGNTSLHVKTKRTTSFFEPRSYDLIIY